MANTVNQLSDRAARNLRRAGFHHDGAGLYLQVTETGARSWVFRYTRDGKAHSMGLGSLRTVSLADARQLRDKCHAQLRDGLDPLIQRELRIAENRAAQAAAVAERASAVTFRQAAERALPSLTSKSANAKHIAQWPSSLADYAYPVLGDLDIRHITPQDIVHCLAPVWKTRSETASRVRGRIEKILNWATASGLRSGDNPASWDAVGILLGAKTKGKNHAALPYAEIPAFMTELRKVDTPAARALEFAILTAARSGEVRQATPDEFDADTRLWRVPASHMKRGREHLVPLSARALELAQGLGGISDDAMRNLMRNLRPDVTVHGFRSTFRDWCAEQTSFEGYVAEAALAHELGDKTEAAYHRSVYLDKRRRLMNAWADYCAGKPVADNNVVQLQTAR